MVHQMDSCPSKCLARAFLSVSNYRLEKSFLFPRQFLGRIVFLLARTRLFMQLMEMVCFDSVLKGIAYFTLFLRRM